MFPSKDNSTDNNNRTMLEEINKAQNRRRESMRKLYETMESGRSLESQGSGRSSLSSILHNLCGSRISVASSQEQNHAFDPPPAMLDEGRNEDACNPAPHFSDEDSVDADDNVRINLFMKAMGFLGETDGDVADCRSSIGMSSINQEPEDEQEEPLPWKGSKMRSSTKSSASCPCKPQNSCQIKEQRFSFSSLRNTGLGQESPPCKSHSKELILATLREFQTEMNGLPFPVRTDGFGGIEDEGQHTDATSLSLADGAMTRSKNLGGTRHQVEDASNKRGVTKHFRRKSKRLSSRSLMPVDEMEMGYKNDCDLHEQCGSKSVTAQRESVPVVTFDEILPLSEHKSTLTDPAKCVTPVSSRRSPLNSSSSVRTDERGPSFTHLERPSPRSVFMKSFQSLAESLEDFDEGPRNNDIGPHL